MSIRKLNGNVLKIIALISMTFDHVGEELLHNYLPFRIIGRLSFPLFAYMIAEGCRYTKNKKKHFLMIFLLGTGCQLVFSISQKSLYMGILITFSLSIALIYAIQFALRKKKALAWCLPLFCLAGSVFLTELLPLRLTMGNYQIDYGFFGILLPVLVYLPEKREHKLIAAAVGLFLLSLHMGGTQWFSLSALIPLLLYNGERGRRNMKYLFYIYYPAHLVIIYLIGEFMKK